MKYINLNKTEVKVEFKTTPNKIVKAGGVINLSKKRYLDLKNRDLKEVGLKPIKNSELQKLFKTKEYKEIAESGLLNSTKSKSKTTEFKGFGENKNNKSMENSKTQTMQSNDLTL